MNQQPVYNSQQCTEKQPREDCRPKRCIPLEEQSSDNSGKRKHGADRKINASGGDDECHTDRQQQPERICFQNIDQISDCEKSAGAYAEEHSKQQAEADKQSKILDAEAAKEAAIRIAEGEAEAIIKVQQATAKGIELINSSNPGDGVIALKSLEALGKLGESESTKLVIPSNIQGAAGLAAAFKEIIK